VKKERNIAIKEFGIPSWMRGVCPYCQAELPETSIFSFGVCLSPIFFGDFYIDYVCPKCDSMCELHFESSVLSMPDIAIPPDKKPVTRESIINKGVLKVDPGIKKRDDYCR
jgi:hypothetical protein